MKDRNKLRTSLLAGAIGLFAFSVTAGLTMAATLQNGEAGFKEYCAGCHFEGGNLINPAKTLSKKDREKNGVRTVNDVVKIMRNPGEGMSTFDEKTLPETEAKKIAEYILTTFK